MRITVLGGTGHIGTFLVPRLVRAGHEVTVLSRTAGTRYAGAPEWEQVRHVAADREQLDRDGTIGQVVLATGPEAVIDLVCFTEESSAVLVAALRGEVDHLVHCGSIWRHGPSRSLPITESGEEADEPVDTYGVAKRAIAQALRAETASGGLVTTSLHPGHIVGPGWHPTGPVGTTDPEVWRTLSAGGTIRVPGSGAETLHHVHADDVAQAFELAVAHRDAVAGEDLTVVAPNALSVRGYLAIASAWFGAEAQLEPVSWETFREEVTPELAEASWGHLHRSQVFSIDKARTLLGYAPAYRAEEAILESVRWLVEHGELDVARPLQV